MIITKDGYTKLQKEIYKLKSVDLVSAIEELENTRPIGVGDEFPTEYIQALETINMIENKISKLQNIFYDIKIFDKTMIKDNNAIGFGATVEIENVDTEKKFNYTIVSSYESDISNGYISIESPMVCEMLGLKIDDEFEVNNNCYVINSIEYHF